MSFRTSRLPVVYVFGKKKIDINHCAKMLVDALNSQVPCDGQRTDSPILLRHDVVFTHLAGTWNPNQEEQMSLKPRKMVSFRSSKSY